MKIKPEITNLVYLIEPQNELAKRAKYFSPGAATYKTENWSHFLALWVWVVFVFLQRDADF